MRRHPFQKTWPILLFSNDFDNMLFGFVTAAEFYGSQDSQEKIIEDFKGRLGMTEDDVATQALKKRYHQIRNRWREMNDRMSQIEKDLESGKTPRSALLVAVCNSNL